MPFVLVIKSELSELHGVEIFLCCLEIDLKSYAKRNDSRCDLMGLAEVARTAADLIGGVQGRLHAIRLLSLPVGRSNNFGEVAHG